MERVGITTFLGILWVIGLACVFSIFGAGLNVATVISLAALVVAANAGFLVWRNRKTTSRCRPWKTALNYMMTKR